ncbi:tissue factor pathway inhibitor-like [Stegodyphus dumicola]|uniref:tissue factor pathway inhibitor-like n=1 Tax=Stegodyphus dumicola TaxID=202533 RepID=UPI0015ABEC47|nr:tissue factor pathway inhibitor-like [Stegodyphus dumicola]
MKALILLCAVTLAFASEDFCPENEHFEQCGTACPDNCKNYRDTLRPCVLMCVSGCFCDKGFVRGEDGRCIKPESCPSQAEIACPANQHFERCGTACPDTCKNYRDTARPCVLMCVPGCVCDKGLVKAEDGSCIKPESCPSQAKPLVQNCHDKPDPGMCLAYVPSWYYDKETGTCQKFIYGGCQGNGNRYATEEECLEKCKDVTLAQTKSAGVCELPAVTGPCRALFHRYYFDSESRQCKKFVYGGCRGNENNFKTLRECERTCGAGGVLGLALDRPDCDKAPETGVCRAYIRRYYYDQKAGMCKTFIYGGCGGNRNNFVTEEECYNKCGALASMSACDQEKETGPCKAAFRRFYYNKQTGECEPFIYGGCQGNSNNFLDKEDCEAVCKA